MKKTLMLLLLFVVHFASKAQDDNIITNLQLKGGTIKLIVAVIHTNIAADTSLLNMYHKWREDYIDGSVPADNANVTISTTKTANVIFVYSLLMRLPAGYIDTENFLTDYRTSILSKRNTNPVLDAGLTAIENVIASEYGLLKIAGNGSLQSK